MARIPVNCGMYFGKEISCIQSFSQGDFRAARRRPNPDFLTIELFISFDKSFRQEGIVNERRGRPRMGKLAACFNLTALVTLSIGDRTGLECARGGMADTPDLGSGPARVGGSSPLARTTEGFFRPQIRGQRFRAGEDGLPFSAQILFAK